MNIDELSKVGDEVSQDVPKNLDNVQNEANYQWVVPLIEGAQPSPRGGHTATKVGRYIIFFGVN
jgi:hypothetical protein